MVAALHSHLTKGLGLAPALEGNAPPRRGPPTAPAHSQPSLGSAPADIGEKRAYQSHQEGGRPAAVAGCTRVGHNDCMRSWNVGEVG